MQKPQNYPTQPEHLWNHFFDFTQTPRPSKEEEKIRQHLIGLAEKYKHEYKTDDEGNIVIYVPGSKDKENLEPVIIQNHIDMVTDATPDRKINFSTDPIITKVEGDWLKADRTTLGADNGIGCAAALALMTDDSISHPPLELLFTTDEETGLNGAWGVQSSFFKAKRMINLDTEEWGSLYTGCAGGIDKQFNKKIEMTKGADGLQAFKLTIGKLRGGHSGVDIHMQLGNAIKLLGEYLKEIKIDMELAEFRGGRAHNIIPRDAYAIIRTEMKNEQRLIDVGNELVERWKSYLPEDDQGVNLTIERIDGEFEVIQKPCDIISAINMFPHGAHSYLLGTEEKLVYLSDNLAQVIIMNGHFYIMSSIRFFDREEAKTLEAQYECIAHMFGFDLTSDGEYPSWKPAPQSDLVDLVKKKCEETFKFEPKVTAIHAGLECGILRDQIGPVDAVSFGPTIMGAHSPDERVSISSVEKFWKLLVNVIEAL